MKLVNLGTWVFLFCFCNNFNDPQIHSDLKVASWVQRRYMSPSLCSPVSLFLQLLSLPGTSQQSASARAVNLQDTLS